MSSPLSMSDETPPFIVTDLKQWLYCPRVLYFHLHLPHIRPVTYKMEAGIEAGWKEAEREARRSLRPYGLSESKREFNLSVSSRTLGLRGVVDMVIWQEGNPKQVIPVDFKLSKKAGAHFKLQLAAYALMLEEKFDVVARRGFLYFIPLRKAQEVRFTPSLRKKVHKAFLSMQHILESEAMPAPTTQRGKCVACEFRRFCNDVL